VSGAIRAIRHPERYGPRAARGGGGDFGRSRARGLTRAIIDTFPIVKFGQNTSDTVPDDSIKPSGIAKDVEAQMEDLSVRGITGNLVIPRIQSSDTQGVSFETEGNASQAYSPSSLERPGSQAAHPSASTSRNNASVAAVSPVADNEASVTTTLRPTKASVELDEIVPEAIGRETCPICIVDFEEGDDLRVLPCEGNHRFHQRCVDPWLLELSSSCPICRQDFQALETLLSGDAGDDVPQTPSGERHRHSGVVRFSRYLRFARRRRREQEDHDPTDPSLPTAPVTSMSNTALPPAREAIVHPS